MFFIFCIFIVPLSILLILLYVSRRQADDETDQSELLETCAICQNDFPIKELVEKEVGDYGRVYCFCLECVQKLSNEFNSQNGINQENN